MCVISFQLLLKFLKKIVDNHKENKMTPGNVATVMAPTLFPFDINPTQDMEKINKDNIFSNKAVQMLVKYQDILWSVSDHHICIQYIEVIFK